MNIIVQPAPKWEHEGTSAMTTKKSARNGTEIPLAVRFAANHLGVSARRQTTPDEFVRALSGGDASVDAQHAVQTFLNEADPAEIADLVTCGVTSFSRLFQIAKQSLPPLHPNRVYLEQFAA